MAANFSGLQFLATAVVVLDEHHAVCYANPAAEDLLGTGAKSLLGQAFVPLFGDDAVLEKALADAMVTHWDYSAQNVTYARPGHEAVLLSCVLTRIDAPDAPLLAELRPIEQQLRVAREERLIGEQLASRELIRNLAHEIKNPLGGLRGSAQLLERELDRAELREYTQVIIKEADRLQSLMDRLLTPHRTPRMAALGIHEVLERVRSLVLAEFATGISIDCDYDPSIPDMVGDKEQLIQAVLNVVRNAAQALTSNADARRREGRITLRTRALRQITLLKQRYRLALELHVIDDGPGVSDDIREKIFNPLVSGRDGGSGLGLSLAQTFVHYHRGTIECDSRPGRTVFRILLPLA